MWKKILELEPKEAVTIVTCIGGLILAFWIFNAYRDMAEIKTVDIYNAQIKQTEILFELKETMNLQVEATRENTEATKNLQSLLRASSLGIQNDF